MTYPPAIADFKAYFVREFVYGGTPDTVMDADISRAINEVGPVFNIALWASASETQIAYFYAAAHFLVQNLKAAGGLALTNLGIGALSSGTGTIESKSVGSVSVSYAIPDMVRQNPILSQFMETGFGQRYLQLVTPRLVGNVGLVYGDGDPTGEHNVQAVASIPPLSITTLALTAGTHAVAYGAQLTATGGLAPISWSLYSGVLPAGVSFSTTGLLSGTPTAAGTYYFTVQATDARTVMATQNYQWVIS